MFQWSERIFLSRGINECDARIYCLSFKVEYWSISIFLSFLISKSITDGELPGFAIINVFLFSKIDFRSLLWGNLNTKNSFFPNNSFENYLINAVLKKSHCSPVVKKTNFVRVPFSPSRLPAWLASGWWRLLELFFLT